MVSVVYLPRARAQPPAPKVTSDAAVQQSLLALRERLGDLEQYAEPRKTDSAQWSVDTAGAIEGTQALLDALGESNPILQGLLNTAMDEIRAAGQGEGRRLMQRKEYNTRMTDVLISHEIMQFYGKGGIPGVTSGSCQVHCAFEHFFPLIHTIQWTRMALLRSRSAKPQSRTSAPSRPTNVTLTPSKERPRSATPTIRGGATCCRLAPMSNHTLTNHLLTNTLSTSQNAGACKLEDFGVEL